VEKIIKKARNIVATLKGKQEILEPQRQKRQAERDRLAGYVETLEGSLSLAKKCIERSIDTKVYLEEIVGSALTDIFDMPYQFLLDPVKDKAGNLMGLKPMVSVNGEEFESPYQDDGGGCNAIISCCIRIGVVIITPSAQKIIFIDEPIAELSKDLDDRFHSWLEAVAEETGLQVFMITHASSEAGKVYYIDKVEEEGRLVSRVKLVDK
jgi:DNA repair exonuclease SbcCD ATPase subunit